MKKAISLAAVCFYGVSLSAQRVAVDHLSKSDLDAMATKLEAQAKQSGVATERLKDYGPDATMLTVRTKSGGAEQHAQFSDLFFVVRGKGTLLSGGDLENASDAGAGERKGTGLHDAKSTVLGPGDVIHVPPGLPHQLILTPGTSFVYYVVKVKEAPAAN